MKIEVWKPVNGYEWIYEISDLGRVKSLPRMMYKARAVYVSKELIKKSTPNPGGYLTVSLNKNRKKSTRLIHQLVAIAFLNHARSGNDFVVDHINGNKTDNKLENLRIVTGGQNTQLCFRKKTEGLSSKYIGVMRHKNKNWRAYIKINGKPTHLGCFDSEEDASAAYQNALNKLRLLQFKNNI